MVNRAELYHMIVTAPIAFALAYGANYAAERCFPAHDEKPVVCEASMCGRTLDGIARSADVYAPLDISSIKGKLDPPSPAFEKIDCVKK